MATQLGQILHALRNATSSNGFAYFLLGGILLLIALVSAHDQKNWRIVAYASFFILAALALTWVSRQKVTETKWLFLGLGSFLLLTVIDGMKKGVLPTGAGAGIKRLQNPLLYWITFTLYAWVVVFCFMYFLFMALGWPVHR